MALLLLPLLAVCLGGLGPAGHARAEGGPGNPGRPSAGQGLQRAFADAARAGAAYQRARAVTAAQYRVTEGRRRTARVHRARLGLLSARLGALARAQYRAGPLADLGGLAAERDPQSLLRRLGTLRQGERAAARVLRAHEGTGERLRRARDAAERRLREARAAEDRQKRLRETVRGRLWGLRDELLRRGRVKPGCPVVPLPADSRPAPGRRWTLPTEDYVLSAGYGGVGGRWASRHSGQDFAVDQGTPIYAVGDGVVERVDCSDGFGNQIVLRHPDGTYTQYAHLSLILAEPGQRVRTGQLVGLAGSTGNSSGPHLHFEARLGPEMGSAVDPVAWMARRGVSP
ncbi:M23 family metallopeptidase [Streptomyces sp. AJS327]|uniref:M23 family metallopeptidase n=1 Tax=Streptomyces sp. AJS327 TaxID=2545265 RepID=UPI0015DF7367|nr:M23 family metallopeptidase [Streptomyces sp. AJS327]